MAISYYLRMLLQPGVDISEYLVRNFPREEMSSVGVAQPLRIYQVLSSF